MQLDSVRELKAALQKSVVAPLMEPKAMPRTLALAAGPPDATHRTLALGIARKGTDDFQLAVRIQRPELQSSAQLDAIRSQAKGEVDVRYIGRLIKRARRIVTRTVGRAALVVAPAVAVPWYQKRCRPLRIGASIGHYKITAGTLGCFVKSRADGTVMILSNNHVLANENNANKNGAKPGDDILQQGQYDGGKRPGDVIGKLADFVKLKAIGANMVDCAVCSIKKTIKYDYKNVGDWGALAGLGPAFLDRGTKVRKTGRTTGPTEGSVTAFEMDNVVITYDLGDLTFNNQIEIEGAGNEAFSAGGDSGSLIVDADLTGIGLLFAGGDHGGSNNKGLTYANPLKDVLDALKVDLLY
ncbi:MAG: hypothetical protein JWL69_1729 [Phycisphaerales bacterium]|nr:hypothetical protein [Phycisphaerales bacterium]